MVSARPLFPSSFHTLQSVPVSWSSGSCALGLQGLAAQVTHRFGGGRSLARSPHHAGPHNIQSPQPTSAWWGGILNATA